MDQRANGQGLTGAAGDGDVVAIHELLLIAFGIGGLAGGGLMRRTGACAGRAWL